MTQWSRATVFMLLLGGSVAAGAQPPAPESPARARSQDRSTKADAKEQETEGSKGRLSKDERFALIRRSHVWNKTNVPEMNMRLGPQGEGAFPPHATVTCDYVETKMSGGTQKFNCTLGPDDVLKVRYGATNGEVIGSVLASRLLWALGFGADAVYPVSVTCRGCSADPWTTPARTSGEHTFELAVIERKPAGRQIGKDEDGWTWPELLLANDIEGGAPVAQTDALTLLAVMLQHTDSKGLQQRLWCPPDALTEGDGCTKPFLMIHDVGLTFGQSNFKNTNDEGSVNFTKWVETPVWRDGRDCVGHLTKSFTGTLSDPIIGEAGRAFLADLLQQLTDQQLRDLFDVARVNRRSRNPDDAKVTTPASTEEWVKAFKQKRDEIVAKRCPH